MIDGEELYIFVCLRTECNRLATTSPCLAFRLICQTSPWQQHISETVGAFGTSDTF